MRMSLVKSLLFFIAILFKIGLLFPRACNLFSIFFLMFFSLSLLVAMSDSIVGSLVEIYNTVSTNTGVKPRRKQEIVFEDPADPSHVNGKKSREFTIFDFAKNGDVVSLREAATAGGLEVLNERDRAGHTLAHWAALHGHVVVLQLIMELGGPFHESSEHELGQFPIHWACVNGYVPVIELLLQAGACVDAVDKKGCTPLIIACQYGKTVVVAYLLGKGASFTVSTIFSSICVESTRAP